MGEGGGGGRGGRGHRQSTADSEGCPMRAQGKGGWGAVDRQRNKRRQADATKGKTYSAKPRGGLFCEVACPCFGWRGLGSRSLVAPIPSGLVKAPALASLPWGSTYRFQARAFHSTVSWVLHLSVLRRSASQCASPCGRLVFCSFLFVSVGWPSGWQAAPRRRRT